MSEPNHDLWNNTLSALEPRIKPHNFDLWLRPIRCVEIGESLIRLAAPNRYVKEWFEDNYLPIVVEALRDQTRAEFRIVFDDIDAPLAPGGSATVPAPAFHPSLNARYTFETFVTGPSNLLAQGAARAAADLPGLKWNPLFLYGGVGLGKTHLCQAVGHHAYRRNPGARVLYLSAERFTNEFVESLRGGRIDEFRRRYREECDVLLVDDVELLAGKDRTQDEFFHTFNALYDQRKQIVLTSDRMPHEIDQIEERLKSRFAQGLIADIEPPDFNTKVAILRRKAELEKIALADDVAQLVATMFRSNVRELEGALIRIAAHASMLGQPITLESARAALASVLRQRAEYLTAETVQKAVANYFNVKVADMRGPRRHRTISIPRQIGMYLTRKLCRLSFPEIGHRFGGKDHSTVITACRKMDHLYQTDPSMRHMIEQIERTLQGAGALHGVTDA